MNSRMETLEDLSPAVRHLVEISDGQLRDELPYYDGPEAARILREAHEFLRGVPGSAQKLLALSVRVEELEALPAKGREQAAKQGEALTHEGRGA